MLSGTCVLIVEDETRPLRQWDFFHSPPGTAHAVVGAGDGPCAVLMVGGRGGEAPIMYPASDVAGEYRRGAGSRGYRGGGGRVRQRHPAAAHAAGVAARPTEMSVDQELLDAEREKRAYVRMQIKVLRRMKDRRRDAGEPVDDLDSRIRDLEVSLAGLDESVEGLRAKLGRPRRQLDRG